MKKILLSLALGLGLFFAAGATPAQAEPWHHDHWHGHYRPWGAGYWYRGYYGHRPYWFGYYQPWVGYYGPRYYGYYGYPAYYYNPYPVVTSYSYGYPGVGFYFGF
jgi:hypothetical protein